MLPDISTNNETETVSVAFASKSTDLDQLASGINQNEIYHYNRQVQNGAETINIIRVSVAESGSSATSWYQPRMHRRELCCLFLMPPISGQ